MSSTTTPAAGRQTGPDAGATTPDRAVVYPSLGAAWIPMAALCLAFFVEMVDNTVLTIAMPTIGRALDATTTDLQWVTGAYSLTFGGLMLTAGSIADRFGRRRTLMTGLAAFGAMSALVWLVGSAGELIALRALLGVAAACMAPVTNSLVFRLFDDDVVRMRAITVMMVVGMSGFAFGPVLAGSLLGHIRWEWLLSINVPIAILAAVGVWLGVPKDRRDDLHEARFDLPGIACTIGAIALFCYTFTSGVENSWASVTTIACAVGAVVFGIGFVLRERSAAEPMLDVSLLTNRTISGSALAQLASSVAMIGSMFGLIMLFQYAWGWSPLKAGLANLPMVVTMLAASPLAEGTAKRFGHRVACLIGTALLAASMVAQGLLLSHGYLPVAITMVTGTIGLRIVMTICAIALVAAMPENRTSMGTALNDTAQELGNSVGVAVVGTIIAAVAGAALPSGAWSSELVHAFYRGERWSFIAIGAITAVVGLYGSSTLTDSHESEEPH